MYEDIRKPDILRDIPLLLIRGLSPVYYFCRFVNNHPSEKAENIYLGHLNFIASLVRRMGEELKSKELCQLATRLTMLENIPDTSQIKELEKITSSLSDICKKMRTPIEQLFRDKKTEFVNLYQQNIDKLKILLVDNNNEPERVNKVASLLKNFCYYEVDTSRDNAYNYPKKLIDNDFIFFASTHPATIHDLFKSLNTYKKPGLAVAYIEKDGNVDRQAIRHGAQLQKVGCQVLYKVFTPIRLFTSIDKIYMKYQLAS
jgi:hypothetical protein